MPNVIATPISRNDGSIVTEFLDVTSVAAVTYTFPTSQNKLIVTNNGVSNIIVTVGTQTNVSIGVNETKEFSEIFTSFSIRSVENSQAFKVSSIVEATAVDTSQLLTKTEASSTYATKSQLTPLAVKTEVASTYETKANATATYETKTNAAATYETKTNATTTYATKSQLTPLAVKTEVAATYQTIALAETKANATATYETKTNAAATYGKVKTVNGVAPDSAGNVEVTTA